jgi:acyl carrier protein
MGVAVTPIDEAMKMLDALLMCGMPRAVAVDIDWSRLRDLYRSRRPTALFDQVQLLTPVTPLRPPTDAAGRSAVLSAPAAHRRDVLLAELRALVARVVNVASVAGIDSAAGFFDLGVDSLGAMELRRLLDERFGLSLPATILFETGTLDELADDILQRLGASDETATDLAAIHAPAAMLEALSEQEVESMLLKKLEELG